MTRPVLKNPSRSLLATGLASAAVAFVPATAGAVATDGTITPVAGTVPGFAGDGGPAGQARLDTPRDVAVLADGSIVIADFANDRIRRITPGGTMTTAAGSSRGISGNGGPAAGASLDRPRGVTAMPDGGYLIADTFNNQVRRVLPSGQILALAGSGVAGAGGDGGPAGAAQLNQPSDTAVMPGGAILIADTGNDRIRMVTPGGIISTVTGSVRGFAGDGRPALLGQLDQPRDVAVATDGAIVIADTGNNRVRRIGPDGVLTTIAGVGAGLAGDGDPAATAKLNAPFSVAPLPNGGVLVADTGNDRVRRVTPLGAIIPVAGTTGGLTGDGGLAKVAQLQDPGAVTPAPGGGFLVADSSNARIRRVSDVGAVPAGVVGRSFDVAPGFGSVTVRPLGMPASLPLREEDIVPVSSQVDATAGGIFVTTTNDAKGTQQTANVYAGGFTLSQRGGGGQPVTTLFRLPVLTGCRNEPEVPATTRGSRSQRATPRAFTASIAATKKAKKKKRVKRLWVNEKGGRWRSATGSVSAAAVGTAWLTTLQCDGTRVTVKEGRVLVRDKIRGKNTLLRPGQSVKVTTRGGLRGA